MAGHRTVHVLTGCTAAGKTETAVRWAERAGAEIISCDSLLFYRGMDVGTAKPDASARARVRHHLIDLLPVRESMDAVRYAAMARQAAEEIAVRGRPALAVGGSGFYLKSFFGPVADAVQVPPAVRAQVEQRLAEAGLGALVEELRRLNPGGLGRLDAANPRRVARALERCLASGRTLAELAETFARAPGAFDGWTVRLAEVVRPPEELDRRIVARARTMLASGLEAEVRRLEAEGLRNNPSAAAAIGYRECLAVADGRLAAEALEGEIVRSTRALVKKQRTWFRTQLPAHPLVAPEDPPPPDWFSPAG